MVERSEPWRHTFARQFALVWSGLWTFQIRRTNIKYRRLKRDKYLKSIQKKGSGTNRKRLGSRQWGQCHHYRQRRNGRSRYHHASRQKNSFRRRAPFAWTQNNFTPKLARADSRQKNKAGFRRWIVKSVLWKCLGWQYYSLHSKFAFAYFRSPKNRRELVWPNGRIFGLARSAYFSPRHQNRFLLFYRNESGTRPGFWKNYTARDWYRIIHAGYIGKG